MVARFKGAIMVPSAAARFLVVMGAVVAGLFGFAMIETWSIAFCNGLRRSSGLFKSIVAAQAEAVTGRPEFRTAWQGLHGPRSLVTMACQFVP